MDMTSLLISLISGAVGGNVAGGGVGGAILLVIVSALKTGEDRVAVRESC
jgi:hypothetical protein